MTRNTAADYQRCADAGMTRTETARALGVAVDTVCRQARTHGLKFRRTLPKGRRVGTMLHTGVMFEDGQFRAICEVAEDTGCSFGEIVRILCDKSLETYTIKHKE